MLKRSSSRWPTGGLFGLIFHRPLRITLAVLLGLLTPNRGSLPQAFAEPLPCEGMRFQAGTYRYLDMVDDPVAVTGSQVFSESLYGLRVELGEGKTEEFGLGVYEPTSVAHLRIHFARSRENGRCRMLVSGDVQGGESNGGQRVSFSEFYEVLAMQGSAQGPKALWLGDANAVGGEIYFSLLWEAGSE